MATFYHPWQDKGDLAKTFWSMGHRNLLGISFDPEGRLWAHEMGPRHGDELNLIEKGGNYGWPLVSNGDHYSGEPIPDHDTRPEFNAPNAFWVPAISPAGFVIYDGDIFPGWHGDGFIGGLSSEALVRVDIAGDSAKEAERFEWGERIREVEEGPNGALWVLEDPQGNYGWPLVSNGDHYSGEPIPDHDTRPEFNAPNAFWVPAISPAGFVIYDGDIFPGWHGDGFIGGLSSEALVRVDIAGDSAKEAERFEWGERIREVEEGPNGALWVLEDGSDARLLKLTPKN